MRRYTFIIAFLLIFIVSLIGWPLMGLAADEVSFTADTTILLDNGLSFTVISGSLCDEMVVYSTYVTFTISGTSTVELRSTNRYLLSNTQRSTDCDYSASYSRVVLTAGTITVTPPSSTCSPWQSTGSPGGGGGGGTTTTTTIPSTITGQVTATASGGKTTYTTAESASTTIELPANAVSSSTNIAIYTESKSSVTSSKPVPSGKNIVGGYVYNFTATSGGLSVTTFSKDLTLTFTYTDSQITGLSEDSLKIYYWNGSSWTALASTVDKANNKITTATKHFTYFVIMGESETPTKLADPADYGLKEGDLIKAEGDFDIFIINQYGYKRLFLNPAIFNMYGHLTGGWNAVKTVTTATRDVFVTSTHYRYVNSPKVYHLTVTGEDTGTLHWINMTAENFLAQGGNADAIFIINKSELDWYPKGADKTSL